MRTSGILKFQKRNLIFIIQKPYRQCRRQPVFDLGEAEVGADFDAEFGAEISAKFGAEFGTNSVEPN